ncbi:MAG TPA: tryptophan halogenase family protein [Sphingomicrobium sp.]|nr:tryptophan halogenase family protein [Sphingomicrobium sp.]
MTGAIRRVVIVGGGTAGWLSACSIAAAAGPASDRALSVTLVESPDIPTIGVGEGTWPTIRRTLERIGIREAEFLVDSDASFKQGSRFDGWRTGEAGEAYYHPFVAPLGSESKDALEAWQSYASGGPFAEAVCPQPKVCALDLAPKQRTMPDYAGALNYAYHLDAGKLVSTLARHATQRLGVRHIRDHVTEVVMTGNDDIGGVRTRDNGTIEGDLFIDCTGHAAMLIEDRFGVPFVDRSTQLFNDRALAVQVPVEPGSAIASQTIGTAHSAGWLWDIGLPSRRGVGCVYSSSHIGDEGATAALYDYLKRTAPGIALDDLSVRRLTFRSGHRAEFWKRNCIAIGLSAGFLEPLEASAIVLIELSLNALIDNFPTSRDTMEIHAGRFNRLFAYRWERIIEFLKLHYTLSEREEPYWRDHRRAETVPDRLTDLLRIWKDQPPSTFDLPEIDEIFPAASYQYVLYGMGFPPPLNGSMKSPTKVDPAAIRQVHERGRALASVLPTNRAYLDALRAPLPAETAQ